MDKERALDRLKKVYELKNDKNLSTKDKFVKILNIYQYMMDAYNDYFLLLDTYDNKEELERLAYSPDYINRLVGLTGLAQQASTFFNKYYNEHKDEAIELVTRFINTERLISYGEFTSRYLLTPIQFNSASYVVKKEDYDLYLEYFDKLSEITINKYTYSVEDLKSIVLGIETGYLKDNTKFSEIEFWKLLPFKYGYNVSNEFDTYKQINPNIVFLGTNKLSNRIKGFGMGVIADKIDLVMDYMKNNNIEEYKSVQLYNYRLLEDNPKRIDRKLFDSSIINENVKGHILKEIIEKDLPHLDQIYYILEKEFVDKYSIDHKEEINKKKQELLKEKDNNNSNDPVAVVKKKVIKKVTLY